jgi:hypothetical protein
MHKMMTYYLAKMTDGGPVILTGRDGRALEFRDGMTAYTIARGMSEAGGHVLVVDIDTSAEVLNLPLDNIGKLKEPETPAPEYIPQVWPANAYGEMTLRRDEQ